MKRDAFLCQKCKADGRLTLGTQVDHRVPKAEGGTDDLGNLQLMCSRCHDEKSKAEASRGRNGRGSWNRKHPGGVPQT
ncbi:HNH endonuclease [Lysobacter antibioticus]|uniref:HNH endonuclease n=1 Tax=Lysobacter antibioticus TaxID=84531 RepID=UPI003D18DADB